MFSRSLFVWDKEAKVRGTSNWVWTRIVFYQLLGAVNQIPLRSWTFSRLWWTPLRTIRVRVSDRDKKYEIYDILGLVAWTITTLRLWEDSLSWFSELKQVFWRSNFLLDPLDSQLSANCPGSDHRYNATFIWYSILVVTQLNNSMF